MVNGLRNKWEIVELVAILMVWFLMTVSLCVHWLVMVMDGSSKCNPMWQVRFNDVPTYNVSTRDGTILAYNLVEFTMILKEYLL